VWNGSDEWRDVSLEPGIVEKGCADPGTLPVRKYPVFWRPVLIIGPHLEQVADVDDQGIWQWVDRMPMVLVAYLKRGHIVLNQYRERAGVGMSVDPQMPAGRVITDLRPGPSDWLSNDTSRWLMPSQLSNHSIMVR
jgi:hypothetical protein